MKENRLFPRVLCAVLAITALGCEQRDPTTAAISPTPVGPASAAVATPQAEGRNTHPNGWLGFDRNDYPGDATMAAMHNTFAFTGYWLTNPPGESANSWRGKRALLKAQGWGFLVLANGRLDAQILKAQKAKTSPAELGRADAASAAATARRDGFPPHTVLFLDQEEGGRLLPEQAAYLLAWTEAVAGLGFRPGVYASGQQVEDPPGVKIDTIEDVRARVKAGNLQEVAIFDALDECPPAAGCTTQPKPLSAAPDPDLVAWQYAQSPRRPEITQSCRATYAPDNNCYAPAFPQVFLDMNVAGTSDPSQGR